MVGQLMENGVKMSTEAFQGQLITLRGDYEGTLEVKEYLGSDLCLEEKEVEMSG